MKRPPCGSTSRPTPAPPVYRAIHQHWRRDQPVHRFGGNKVVLKGYRLARKIFKFN